MAGISLRQTLDNLAGELDRIAHLAERIDEGFGLILARTEPASRSDASGGLGSALQSVDLMRQSLGCLGTFAGALACMVPKDVVIDVNEAVDGLPLRDLARNLANPSGNGGQVSPPDGTITHGDVSLF